MYSRLRIAMLAILTVACAPALLADTLVSTINGFYSAGSCCGSTWDTPGLTISNTTAYDFTNVTLTLTGYQGLNNGISQSVNLETIAAGSTPTYYWGSIPGANGALTPGNLFAYDYDDQYVNTFTAATGFGLVSTNPNTLVAAPQCSPQASIYGWGFCAQTGNFYVTFTATWNNPAYNGGLGTSIYSQFSPDPNLAGAGNAAGTFVGWEGLDQNGWAETTDDDHNTGGPNGVLANIYVGTPPPVTTTPEPSSFLMLGTGLVGAAGAIRRRIKR